MGPRRIAGDLQIAAVLELRMHAATDAARLQRVALLQPRDDVRAGVAIDHIGDHLDDVDGRVVVKRGLVRVVLGGMTAGEVGGIVAWPVCVARSSTGSEPAPDLIGDERTT